MSRQKIVVATGQLPILLALGIRAALDSRDAIELAGVNMDLAGLAVALAERSVEAVILDEHADFAAAVKRLRVHRARLGIVAVLHRPDRDAPERLLARGATTCISTDTGPSGVAAAVRLAAEGIQTVLPGASSSASGLALASLTERQAEIAALIVAGGSTEEIAADLQISTQTVYSHVTAILRKLGVSSRRELRRVMSRPGAL